MRWQLSLVGATERPGCFGAQRENDPARARRIQRELAADRYEHAGEVTLWDALHPRDDAMFVGAYGDGVLVCHADLAGALIHGNVWSRVTGALRSDFRERVLKLYPAGEVMALALHCAAHLWGFAAYRQGQRIRTAAGSADEGVFADGGKPLPEEVPVLARTPLGQLNEAGAGEELVLAASARMFGCGIDRLAGRGPMLSYFRRR